MTLYNVNKPPDTNKPAWALDYASRLERRLELGSHPSQTAAAWLHKPSQPERAAVWYELLSRADVDGVVTLADLQCLRYFETPRRVNYLIQQLTEHQLVTRLDSERVQVLS